MAEGEEVGSLMRRQKRAGPSQDDCDTAEKYTCFYEFKDDQPGHEGPDRERVLTSDASVHALDTAHTHATSHPHALGHTDDVALTHATAHTVDSDLVDTSESVSSECTDQGDQSNNNIMRIVQPCARISKHRVSANIHLKSLLSCSGDGPAMVGGPSTSQDISSDRQIDSHGDVPHYESPTCCEAFILSRTSETNSVTPRLHGLTEKLNKTLLNKPSIGSKLTIEPADHVPPSKTLTDINDSQGILCDARSHDVAETNLNINELPSLLLIKILRCLTTYDLLCRASLVCKHWYQLAHDADLWRIIDLRGQVKVTDEILERLVSLSDRVLELDITDLKVISNKGFPDTLMQCPHLRVLKMIRCYAIMNDGLIAIGDLCHQLRQVYLDNCYTLQDSALQSLGRGCPELTVVHLNSCGQVTDEGIKDLTKGCLKLRTIVLGSCALLTDKCIASVVENCPGLEVLSLLSCPITDKGATQLAKLRELESLDLSSMHVSEVSVIPIVQSCHKLHTLNLSLVNKIDDSCLEHIARNLPLLKHLYVVFCSLTDKALHSLAKYSHMLQVIDLGWCREITEHGVSILSAGCPDLRYVGLIRCDNVTMDAVERFMLLYPLIQYSTIMLEYRKLLERARNEGYTLGIPKS